MILLDTGRSYLPGMTYDMGDHATALLVSCACHVNES